MAVGFRIKTSWVRIAPELVADFAELPVANVSDSMSRLAGLGAGLRPMHRAGNLAGPALTVRCRPGDNLLIHKAIDMAQPGDIIVVDAGGDMTNSLMGELMLAHATVRGVGGFVLNGAIRDADAIRQQDLPLFALGATHRGPYRTGPGEIGHPIALDGTVIEAGDLILGDLDGLVAVRRADADAVLSATRKKHAAEALQMQQTLAGTTDRSWVDRALIDAGCSFDD